MMTQDEIIRMAREAGLHRHQHNLMSNPMQIRFSYDGYEENLVRFAALVAAREQKDYDTIFAEGSYSGKMVEREACAKVCDELVKTDGFYQAEYCAAAIRARGEK